MSFVRQINAALEGMIGDAKKIPEETQDDYAFYCPYCNKKHEGWDNREGLDEGDCGEIECSCGGVLEIWYTITITHHAAPKTPPPVEQDEVEGQEP